MALPGAAHRAAPAGPARGHFTRRPRGENGLSCCLSPGAAFGGRVQTGTGIGTPAVPAVPAQEPEGQQTDNARVPTPSARQCRCQRIPICASRPPSACVSMVPVAGPPRSRLTACQPCSPATEARSVKRVPPQAACAAWPVEHSSAPTWRPNRFHQHRPALGPGICLRASAKTSSNLRHNRLLVRYTPLRMRLSPFAATIHPRGSP
jgi:hypothetical protein